MIPYLETALRGESGEECQTGTSSNVCDRDTLADHFGTLMKSGMPPSLELLLRPFPPSFRRLLYFEHNIESILPMLRDDNAVHLRGFVLAYFTDLVDSEMGLVELLHKQEALLYFLVTYTALVQDRAGYHGLRITRPLFDGQAGIGQGVAAMKRQWAATGSPETESAPAGGPSEMGRLRLPGAMNTPPRAHASPVRFLALELVDVACQVAERVRADRLEREPRLHAPGGLTTLLFLMDDVRFAHTLLAASPPATGPRDAMAASLRLERVKHWQRTWVDAHLGAAAPAAAEGPDWTALDKCCLWLGLLLLGLLLWMCVEVGVVEIQPADFDVGLQGKSLN